MRRRTRTARAARSPWSPSSRSAPTAAVTVAELLVTLTDELSAWIGSSVGGDLNAFASSLGSTLVQLDVGGGAVAGLAALLLAALTAFCVFVLWLELLLRQAAVTVAVLFAPIGFAALVWPSTAHWLRRLVEGLVAIIFSKFVIVSVLSLAASALSNPDAPEGDDGFGLVMGRRRAAAARRARPLRPAATDQRL